MWISVNAAANSLAVAVVVLALMPPCCATAATRGVSAEKVHGDGVTLERTPLAAPTAMSRSFAAPAGDEASAIRRASDPVPTPWPAAFSTTIWTNVTEPRPPSLPATALTGTLRYSWKLQAQRVDHAAGNFECVHFYHTTGPCTLYFRGPSLFAYIPSPDSGEAGDAAAPVCCLDTSSPGAPFPNWTAAMQYVGPSDVFGAPANEWTFGRHLYWSEPARGRPLEFSFPGTGQQNWYFDLSTWVEEPQPDAVFALPPDCAASPPDCSTVQTGANTPR